MGSVCCGMGQQSSIQSVSSEWFFPRLQGYSRLNSNSKKFSSAPESTKAKSGKERWLQQIVACICNRGLDVVEEFV